MLLGTTKEIKVHEYRVGLTPKSVREVADHGHSVLVEHNAGIGIGFSDDDYIAAGAAIAASADEVFAKAELIVKVKEPQPEECTMLRPGQVLFTYLHLAPDPRQTQALMQSGATAIAYETVLNAQGKLPLLAPMSEVAGRMAIQVGARGLEKSLGGAGILLSGVTGVAPGKVVILGGGTVGANAAEIAVGLKAEVTVLNRSVGKLEELDRQFGSRITTMVASPDNVEAVVVDADLIIGAVLVPGGTTPKVVSREMVRAMRNGSAVVDVAIDQGGCLETSRPTTHADPYYVEEGVVHYCVTNMPGGVARTSTQALNNATLPYTLSMADKGWRQSLTEDPGLLAGLNVHAGQVTCAAVAGAQGLTPVAPEDAIA